MNTRKDFEQMSLHELIQLLDSGSLPPGARDLCEEVIDDKAPAVEKEAKRKAVQIERDISNNELIKRARNTGDWSEIPHSLIEKEASNIVLTTSYQVANRRIDAEISIITAECVYGINIFRDILASLSDAFGGRSVATQNVLRDARKMVLTELKREALISGADAVIAVDLDYQEISGGGKSMLFLVASGTAVKLSLAGS